MRIQKNSNNKTLSILIYGPDGLGKTTFASHFPNPIFLGPEVVKGGAKFLDVDVDMDSNDYKGVMNALKWLKENKHEYKTVVVDSLDHLENDIHNTVKKDYNVTNIAHAAGGYGNGYKEAFDKHVELKNAIFELGLNTVLIAHSQVKTFHDPRTEEPYDRHELKLHESASVSPRAMWRESVDGVFFLNKDVESNKKDQAQKAKAKESKEIYAFTKRTPSYDAKCRFVAPGKIEFKLDKNIYEELKDMAFKGGEDLYKEAMNLFKNLKKPDENILKFIESNKENDANLKRAIYRLREIV